MGSYLVSVSIHMTSEWCSCKTETTSGHLTLAPVAEVWVHGECLRPSFAWWAMFEQYCLECGRSFSSPAASECQSCGGDSWADLAAEYLRYVGRRDGRPAPYTAPCDVVEAVETSVEPIDNLRLFVV